MFYDVSKVPASNTNENAVMNIHGKESLWIDRGWRPTDTDKDSGLSEAKLLGSGSVGLMQQHANIVDGGSDYAEVDTRNFNSFYTHCQKVAFFI